MKKVNFSRKLLYIALTLLIIASCSASPDASVDESNTEQAPQAINVEPTMTVEEPAVSQETAGKSEAPPAANIEHTTIPGDPGSADLIKYEIDTANTADRKLALGDSFRLNNFERPFTPNDMVYHPETDLVRLLLSKDADFYYFTLELSGVDEETNYPSAAYGIEIDTDRNGRGDFLLWAQGDSSTEWNIDNVMLLHDNNEDVGGSLPVRPDNNSGDGFDEILFSEDVLDDPDSAWKRVDPASTSSIQLAVKTTLIDNSSFFWRAWADGSQMDPSQFDYNDSISESQAGSPNTTSKFYPVGGLYLMDSTCWIAYNFRPTGFEIGGCTKPPTPPTPLPPPAPPAPQPTQIACPCGDGPDHLGEYCCNECGFTWSGEPFNVCFDPGGPV